MLIGNKDVTNPLKVIECIIAFDSKDYSLNYRDRMLYAIVFGWDDESYTKFGWDNETINEYKELHRGFEKLSKMDVSKDDKQRDFELLCVDIDEIIDMIGK